MTCGVAGCGREIVKGEHLPWVHATNPGKDHHYAKAPSTAMLSTPNGSAASSSPRWSVSHERTPDDRPGTGAADGDAR